MTAKTRAVLKAALALPPAERMLLAEELLEVLSPQVKRMTESEFAAELDRRFAEYEKDPSTAIPLSEVLSKE
jgi:putative addiction module component (TIGR02574 family)